VPATESETETLLAPNARCTNRTAMKLRTTDNNVGNYSFHLLADLIGFLAVVYDSFAQQLFLHIWRSAATSCASDVGKSNHLKSNNGFKLFHSQYKGTIDISTRTECC
jgi:hypothetical protein